jgi:hypothetical protein
LAGTVTIRSGKSVSTIIITAEAEFDLLAEGLLPVKVKRKEV